MDAGLEVTNDLNVLQIGNLYKNYHMMQKGVYQADWRNGDYSGYLPTGVLYSGRNPFIAINNNDYVRYIRDRRPDGTYEFRFIWNGARDLSQVISINYYIYDLLPPVASEHGVGLQTWDDNGVPIFDAAYNPCRILEFIQITAVFPPVGSVTTVKTYDRPNLAVAVCQQAHWILEDYLAVGPGGEEVAVTEYYSVRAITSPNTVTLLDGLERQNTGSPGSQRKWPTGGFMVIDVTGV